MFYQGNFTVDNFYDNLSVSKILTNSKPIPFCMFFYCLIIFTPSAALTMATSYLGMQTG